jgi:hypothetical protein
MRAHEFLIEKHTGKIGQRRSQSTVGLNKFRDADLADRAYELNRVMMAAACTDGTFVPTIDNESWAGRYNLAMPYTDVEQRMLEKAFRAVGSEHEDLNRGDLKSKELDSTNKRSPVQGFQGYPR